MRLIDADMLVDAIEAMENMVIGKESNVLHRVRKMVNAMPTVDAEPVMHAKWDDNHCTNCNKEDAMTYECYGGDDGGFPCESFVYANSRYCPNCGARMDERATSKLEV